MIRQAPLTLVRRQLLPFAIPVYLRDWPDNKSASDGRLMLMLLHSNVDARNSDLSPDELLQLREALDIQPGYQVFASYAEIARSAMSALALQGDLRASALLSAIAAEVFLDDLLAHLLWEEGMRPEAAAPIFDLGFQTRFRQQFHSRLGGAGWGLDKPGVLLMWHENIAKLRHRIVHAGYHPIEEEAREAVAALTQLEHFVIERILSHKVLAKYPRTAVMLVGTTDLQARGRWSKKLERLAKDYQETEWRSTFMRWKHTMQRFRSDPPPGTRPPTLETSFVVAVVHPDRSVVWVLHDRDAHMARRAQPPHTISEMGRESLAALILNIPPNSGSVSIALFGAEAEPDFKYDWVAEYRLLPFAGVMVNARDFDEV
jgi:hypothetical protein